MQDEEIDIYLLHGSILRTGWCLWLLLTFHMNMTFLKDLSSCCTPWAKKETLSARMGQNQYLGCKGAARDFPAGDVKQGQFHAPRDHGTHYCSGFNACCQSMWKYTGIEASTFLHILFPFQSFDWKYCFWNEIPEQPELLGFACRNSFHCYLKIPTCFLPDLSVSFFLWVMWRDSYWRACL